MESPANKLPHQDFERVGDARYYRRLQQGTQEWLELRLGIVTASEMSKVLTPTLKPANNKDTRTQIYELAAQRITKHVEPHFMSWDMERGHLEETDAMIEYERLYEPVEKCGFIINDSLGFDVGFSPDRLVGADGIVENKSRVAKYQIQTVIEHLAEPAPADPIPLEYMLQVQAGLWVTKRKWCDFTSYSNGLHMLAIRCYPIPIYQEAIEKALIDTEAKVAGVVMRHDKAVNAIGARVSPVTRQDYSDEIKL